MKCARRIHAPPGLKPCWGLSPRGLQSWLRQPVADTSLTSADDPQGEVIRREDISLAFVAALQRLQPRQRACLLLHDVLGFSQAEVAEALDLTPEASTASCFAPDRRRGRAAKRRPTLMTRGYESCSTAIWKHGD